MEIKVAMVRKGISGRELARRLSTSQTWVSTRLTGITPLNINDLDKIARALGVSAAELLTAASRSSSDETNDRLSHLSHSVTRTPAGRTARHTASRPIGPAGRPPARPQSPIPAHKRRPTPMGPLKQPMAA
jgi:transcriptional regulator with XRE-family HTH domain